MAERSKIPANRDVFKRLSDFLVDKNFDRSDYDHRGRFIKTNADDQEWLKFSTFSNIFRVHRFVQFAISSFRDRDFLIAIGLDEITPIEKFSVPREVGPGWYTAIVSELKVDVNLNADPYEIYQDILGVNKDDQGLCGHELHSVQVFFDSVSAVEIVDKHLGLERAACAHLSSTYKVQYLPFDKTTLSAFESLVFEGNQSIPWELVANALTAIKWKHAFLELYRCIERLFSIPQMLNLQAAIPVGMGCLNLSAIIERQLGWRPKEDEAIKVLFDYLPAEFLSLLNEQNIIKISDQKAHSYVYGLRNSIAHFRPIHEEARLDDAEWNNLITWMVKCVLELYAKFGTVFDTQGIGSMGEEPSGGEYEISTLAELGDVATA